MKSCTARAVLGLESEGGDQAIDTDVLSANLGRSSLLELPNASWALLKPGTTPTGTTESTLRSSQSINGASVVERDVRAVRTQGQCEIFVFGTSVAKASLVSNVHVMALHSASAQTNEVEGSLVKRQAPDGAWEVTGP
jgi:hypothetical protein